MQNSEIIATKVHGWVLWKPKASRSKYGWFWKQGEHTVSYMLQGEPRFDPENNPDQALDALEAWDESAVYNYYVIQSWPNKVVKLYHGAARVATEKYKNKSLSAAIVEAICSAVGEVK